MNKTKEYKPFDLKKLSTRKNALELVLNAPSKIGNKLFYKTGEVKNDRSTTKSS